MSVSLHSNATYDRFLRQQPAAVIFFSTAECGVCQTLKPQVAELLRGRFPRLAFAEVDCSAAPEVAAQHGVFTAPVLVIYFDGQELLRKARVISLTQLADELERPYALYYGT